ncbi:MAG: flagellar hook-length control protein FliK [Firmicutes bacterium]|nr:flagellar hook-length control protein FliK [Bacillota bacterium]
MIQPQILNLVANLPNKPLPKAGSGLLRQMPKGDFAFVISRENKALNEPEAVLLNKEPLKPDIQKMEDLADTPLKQKLSLQEKDLPYDLYIVAALAAPTLPLLDTVPLAMPSLLLSQLDDLVSILEGNQSITTFNKEIVPLLTKLLQTLQQTKLTLPSEFADDLKEVMARMPKTDSLAEMPLQKATLIRFAETLRGYLCPLENANESPHTLSYLPEEHVNLNHLTASLTSLNEQATFTQEETFSQGQFEEKEGNSSAEVLPGASIIYAPVRLAFAERFNMALQTSRPLSAENVFLAMVERIEALPGADPHMEISLKPAHLGKLSIDLRLGENGLSAKILADDENVRNLLASQINRLSETLALRGVRLENIEILYSALSDRAFAERHGAGEEAGKGAKRDSAKNLIVEPLNAPPQDNIYELPLSGYELAWDVSSVEYRA